MKKADIKKRIDTMRKNARKNPKKKIENPNDKECPFRDKICNEKCKLYRKNKPGYECPFMEMPHMSWNVNLLVEELLGKQKRKGGD